MRMISQALLDAIARSGGAKSTSLGNRATTRALALDSKVNGYMGDRGGSVFKGISSRALFADAYSIAGNKKVYVEVRQFVDEAQLIEFDDGAKWIGGSLGELSLHATQSLAYATAMQMRKNITTKKFKKPLSPVTVEIARARTKFNPGFNPSAKPNPRLKWKGLPEGLRRGRAPLHRPYARGTRNAKIEGRKNSSISSKKTAKNLVEAIQVRKVKAKDHSVAFWVGIPGHIKSPDTGYSFANIARNQETGFTINMQKNSSLRGFFGILAILGGGKGKKTAKKTGPGGFAGVKKWTVLEIPPRIIRPHSVKAAESMAQSREDPSVVKLSVQQIIRNAFMSDAYTKKMLKKKQLWLDGQARLLKEKDVITKKLEQTVRSWLRQKPTSKSVKQTLSEIKPRTASQQMGLYFKGLLGRTSR